MCVCVCVYVCVCVCERVGLVALEKMGEGGGLEGDGLGEFIIAAVVEVDSRQIPDAVSQEPDQQKPLPSTAHYRCHSLPAPTPWWAMYRV